VVGKHIRGHRPNGLVARIAADAVERRVKVMLPEQPLVGQEVRNSNATCCEGTTGDVTRACSGARSISVDVH